MSLIDDDELARLMEALPDALAREELAVQRSLPHLSPADVLDTALRRALVRLRFEVTRETFEELRWKVALARTERRRHRERSARPVDSATDGIAVAGALEEL
jgi:hypothetical protein